jgi:hypothetical protein
MDSGYESEEIAEVIEEAGYQYVVKAKEYSNKARKFAVVRNLKPEEDRKQLRLLESSDDTHACAKQSLAVLTGESPA